MDFFSSDIFLSALARHYYGAKSFEIRNYTIDDHNVRLVEIDGKHPVVSGPFYDFVTPIPESTGLAQPVRFIPKLATRTVALDDREPIASAPKTTQEPAPLVRWDRFGSWEEYLAFVQERSDRLMSRQRRRAQRLTTDHGEISFTFEDRDPKAFEQCVSWKIRQYQGGHETLENRRAMAMLRNLFDDGHLVVSTLKAGGRYVSFHAGFPWQERYLALIPSFDPVYAKYGVGKELLHRMLEYCYRHGYQEFNFLQGGEAFKWDYATHLQIVESAGRPPLSYHITTEGRRLLADGLRQTSPALFYRLKRMILTLQKFDSPLEEFGSQHPQLARALDRGMVYDNRSR